MTTNENNHELEARIKWNKRHLRIVFLISTITFFMLIGHFYLHATGRV